MTKPENIDKVFHEYFRESFQTAAPSSFNMEMGTNCVKRKVTTTMNEALSKIFIKEEVKVVLKKIAHLKSLGLNDFNPSFYQTYWYVVGDEVTSIVLKFLNKCIFDKCINFTYIALIPKTKCPTSASDFYPISLCNVIYKLASKFLANRLKQILPTIIFQN